MVRIRYSESPDSLEVEASGHAGFARRRFFIREKDLVCCAVSTLIQNWEASIRGLCRAEIELESDKKTGSYSARVSRNHDTELITRSLMTGLSVLAEQYRANIKIETEEDYGT